MGHTSDIFIKLKFPVFTKTHVFLGKTGESQIDIRKKVDKVDKLVHNSKSAENQALQCG